MPSIIAHIDMNSYFASVEQQANPLLRGKPVGVVAYLGDNGCIIASSKEAKSFGIKTGCSVARAKQIHPGVVFVENEPAKYIATTQRIVEIFAQYTDALEQYSIDESFLDFTGYVKNFDEAARLVTHIRARIKNEVGEWLTCSAGIATTRWLAKFASDFAKSDSQLVLQAKEDRLRIFDQCDLVDAWGIGDAMKQRLNALGIFTLRQLHDYAPTNLQRTLGKPGYYLWAHLNGIEIEGVASSSRPPKSIGHTYCIPYQTHDTDYLGSILYKLVCKATKRLRALDMEAGAVTAGYALVRGGGLHVSKKLSHHVVTADEIYRYASQLFFSQPIKEKVRMVAVSVSSLRGISNQGSLFAPPRDRDLARALDKLSARYGDTVVYKGRLWHTKDQAQDRIGYRKLK
ncbi:DNA polymerase IV [Candidatus Falkowbacteria bacterium]|nr:DNA polymerase IV [Candidatus Falkowbacteria bacterium]